MSRATRIELDGEVASVLLDVPDRSMNVLSTAVLEELADAVTEASERAGVRAIVLRSAKASGFCAGADVESIGSVWDRDEGARLAALGQSLYARIETLPKPVVAAIHGPCLGGGLELALACDGIMAAHEPKTRLGLPEVRLGIVPGFGGTQRLPRRVGLAAALDMILTGRTLSARQARSRGLVDDMVCPFKLEEAAREYARGLAAGRPPRGEKRRRGMKMWLGRFGPLRSFVLGRARASVMGRTRGVFPAPLKAIECVGLAYGSDRAAGYRAEADAVGELLAGDVSHRLVDLFLYTEELKRRAGDAAGVSGARTSVIGAGVMGAAIARQLLKKGAHVRLLDVELEGLRRGMESIASGYRGDVRRGRMGRHEADRDLDRLTGGTEIGGLRQVDLVIEAVVERSDVKDQVFKALDRETEAEALLATNTSSLSVASIAKSVADPTRVVGLHFFNPVDKMPLVEVVAPEGVPEERLARSVAIARDLGKIPVVVKDSPGFLVNRVLAPYLSEALLLLEDGAEPGYVDSLMRDLGFAMGPMRVLDTVGLDVATAASESLRDFLGERLGAPVVGRLLRDKGHLGEKSGGGIYQKRKKKRVAAEWLSGLLAEARRERGVQPTTLNRDEIRDRLLYAMLSESARALADGIVDSPADVDAAMVLGAGFPPQLGGPLREINRLGARQVKLRLEELSQRYGERFAPPADLAERAAAGRPYHDGATGARSTMETTS